MARTSGHRDGLAPRRGVVEWLGVVVAGLVTLLTVILIASGSELVSSHLADVISGAEDTSHERVSFFAAPLFWGLGLIAAGFVIAIILIRRVQRAPYDFGRTAQRNPRRCQTLVLPLSYLGNLQELRDVVDNELGSQPSLHAATKALQNVRKFQWTPALAAIAHHLEIVDGDEIKEAGPLEQLAILGSSGPMSSHEQIEEFVNVLRSILNGLTLAGRPAFEVRFGPESADTDGSDTQTASGAHVLTVVDRVSTAGDQYSGVNFESIHDVHETVKDLVEDMTTASSGWWSRFRAGRAGRVSIDCTGGTKMVSVGAALASLESRAYLQYVSAEQGAGTTTDFVVTAYDYGLNERVTLNLG